jgi:hypothetical protein
MATSGQYTFSVTRNDIIKDAMRKIGIADAFGEPSNYDIETAASSLNGMLKTWEAQGLHLWKYKAVYLFLQKDQRDYTISTTGDNATTSYTRLVTSNSSSSGSSVLTFTSTTGATNSYYIGVLLQNGTMQWTTIASFTSTTITLTDALTDNVEDGAVVYIYQSKAQKPKRLINVKRRASDGTEASVTAIARVDMFNFLSPTGGDVSQVYFNPDLATSNITTWNKPSVAGDIIVLDTEYPIQIFTNLLDEPDLPEEWYEAMVYGLARRIGFDKGLAGTQEYLEIKELAAILLEQILGFDRENTYVQFYPSEY